MAQAESNPGKDIVKVKIDGVEKEVHRGSHLVTELKSLLGVDPLLDLDEEINGILQSVANDARITIKGGELFYRHARTGASS